MKKAVFRKNITVLTLMLALSLAIWLNWRLAKTESEGLLVTEALTNQSSAIGETASTGAEEEPPQGEDAAEGQYYGEALFVSSDESAASEYFANARTTRTQSRDEALDTLQKSLKQTDLSEAEKNELTSQLLSESRAIETEGRLESLIKAKGFDECLAFVSGEKIKIVVQSGKEGLDASQVAQIKETVISECDAEASNITVVEIK